MTKQMTIAAFLLLAACGGGEEAGNNSADQAGGAVIERTPSNLQDDPNNSVVPIAPPSPTPLAGAAIPARFVGRWGLTAEDCDPAGADVAKGLMVVAAHRVTHYESRGTPTRIEASGPDKIVADLAFIGEGQSWNRRAALTLLDDGRTLAVEQPDHPEPSMRDLRYTRCPAEGGRSA